MKCAAIAIVRLKTARASPAAIRVLEPSLNIFRLFATGLVQGLDPESSGVTVNLLRKDCLSPFEVLTVFANV